MSPRRTIARIAVTLLTAGWVLPAWWSARLYLDHLRIGRISSFPFLEYSTVCGTIGAAWLAAALAYWAWRLSGDA